MNGLIENRPGEAIDTEMVFQMDRNAADFPATDALMPKVDGSILDSVGTGRDYPVFRQGSRLKAWSVAVPRRNAQLYPAIFILLLQVRFEARRIHTPSAHFLIACHELIVYRLNN